MNVPVSATVKQWRHHLTQLPQILALDGRTKTAKKKRAQRCFLIAIATDEELEQMAKLNAEMFSFPVEQELKELKEQREELRMTKKSWVKYLGKSANKYGY
jgi:hypothetical protein